MERAIFSSLPHGSFSLQSVAEGSEIISEVEEIREVENLQTIGSLALESADYSHALEAYQEALEIEEDNPDSLCGRASVYLHLKKYDLALLDADKALELSPPNTKALAIRGQCLGCLGYHREGLLSLLKVLPYTDNRENIAAWIAIIIAKFCPLSEDLDQVLEGADPYRKLYELGCYLYQMRHYDLSQRVLMAAESIPADDRVIRMRLLLTLANTNLALKKVEQAAGQYQECFAIAQAVNDIAIQVKVLAAMGNLSFEAGNMAQSILFYEKLRNLQEELLGDDPENEFPAFWNKHLQRAVYMNLSISYKSIGRIQKAKEHAEKYLTLMEGTEGSSSGHQQLGTLYEILGDYAKACEEYKLCLDECKKAGKKDSIALAYVCLGTICAKLDNKQLSLAYHEQGVKMLQSSSNAKMLTLALEQAGDSSMLFGRWEDARKWYDRMLKQSQKTDTQDQTRALCKIGKTYRSQNLQQTGIYYFELAKDTAKDFGFDDLRMLCEFNLACLLQDSTQMQDLERSRRYFLDLIPALESKLRQWREEDAIIHQEFWEELLECYTSLENVLVKLGENKHCLVYTEMERCHKLDRSHDMDSVFSLDKILQTVDKQEAVVLYYKLQPSGYFLWVLQSGEGLVRFYSRKSSQQDLDLITEITGLLSEIKNGRRARDLISECEARTLPYRTLPYRTLPYRTLPYSKGNDAQQMHAMQTTQKDSGNAKPGNVSPQKRLFTLLLSPVYDILSGLDPDSSVVIVPDGHLIECPFHILQDWNGKLVGDIFRIMYMPSVSMISNVIQNREHLLSAGKEIESERANSRMGGLAKFVSRYCDPESARDDVDKKAMPQHLTTEADLGTGHSYKSSTDNAEATKSRNPRPEHSGSPTMPGIAPLALERMVGMPSLTTLTPRTATKTDITQSSLVLTEFQQLGDTDRCVVIGCPKLPARLDLDGVEWQPIRGLQHAQSECLKVADHLNVSPIIGTQATKSAFLSQLTTATMIHIATYSCHRNGYLALSPDPEPYNKGIPSCHSYIVTAEDIVAVGTKAKLVVLNCGRNDISDLPAEDAYRLPSAFLKAGAQCVLLVLWAVPNKVLDKFFHHLYRRLASETKVSVAIRTAINKLKTDDRFSHPGYWAPFVAIGEDVTLDLTHIQHAMLNQQLNEVEERQEKESTGPYLNPAIVSPLVPSREESLKSLQQCLATILFQHEDNPQAVAVLLELLEGALGKARREKSSLEKRCLPDCVLRSEGSMKLLKLLGFSFHSNGALQNKPYVVNPHWDIHQLLHPAYHSLHAAAEVVNDPPCTQTLCDVLPLLQDKISLLADLLSVTKNLPEIQLNVTDNAVRPLWQHPKIKALLGAMGFSQIGLLLHFNSIPSNSLLLAQCLQFTLAVSQHKPMSLLDHLDINLLGESPPGDKPPNQTAETSRLPSLTPVLLPRNQIRAGASWRSRPETPKEMAEKMALARSKSELKEEYQDHRQRARIQHSRTLAEQAKESLAKSLKPKPKVVKVKVVAGGSSSQTRQPVSPAPTLNKRKCQQRRGDANVVLEKRLNDISRHHQHDVRTLYLPYIANV